jgi:hypothetical protein
MEIKEHTRNQKRMYRIHKQEEKIQNLELLVGKLQRENDKLKKQYEKVLNDYCRLDAYNKSQQKEFIKYLEKRYKDITSVIGSYGSNTDMLYGKKDILEEIFQEFKSIIGDDK